jgi:hypothetical protein
MSRLIYNNRATTPATPASNVSVAFVSTADNINRMVDSSGVVTPLNNTQVNSYVGTGAAVANTLTKIDAGIQVGANTLTAGSIIRFTITGSCTSGAGAGTQSFAVKFGSGNVVGDTSIGTILLSVTGSGSAIPFHAIIEVTIRSIGASGTIYGTFSLLNGDAATTGIYAKASTIQNLGSLQTINTTVTGYFGLAYTSGNAATTTTFQQVVTELIRA